MDGGRLRSGFQALLKLHVSLGAFLNEFFVIKQFDALVPFHRRIWDAKDELLSSTPR